MYMNKKQYIDLLRGVLLL